jgi:hypothetical protein
VWLRRFKDLFPYMFSKTALGYNELLIITLVHAFGWLFWQDNIE